MGQFSWMFADTNNEEDLREGQEAYVPLPNGEYIHEPCYEGYGKFGGQDIYDLVADWNREYLSRHPEFEIPKNFMAVINGQLIRRPLFCVARYGWYKAYADLSLTRAEVVEQADCYEYRAIGIGIACGDLANNALPFPIKICKSKPAPGAYNRLPASNTDPNQGWGSPEENEEETVIKEENDS